MSDSIIDLDIKSLTDLFAAKALSPRTLLAIVLDRIDRFNPIVNAFSLIDRERAAQAAAASEARWAQGSPLSAIDGIPGTVKDIVWSRDWPTTYGSRIFRTATPSPEDAPCVARLKEAGAVLIGMTTTPELGWKAVTDSPLQGITRNPWNCERTPGGSSGGAAVAAALGLGSLHIGTDGGGSIRIPAAFSGVVGHKPSFGRVPAYPMSAFGTVSHIGPIGRSVSDVATMLTVMSQTDPRDWHSQPATDWPFESGLDEGIAGLRIAYSETLGYVDVASDVADAVQRAAQRFEELGAAVEAVDPGFECPQEMFHKFWFAGANRRLGTLPDGDRAQLDPGLADIAKQGASIDLETYLDAGEARAQLGRAMRAFHQEFDLLLTPTLPIPAFGAGQETPDPDGSGRWTDWTGFSYPFNLTQQPACSLPCGLTADGLPIGLQIVGPMFGDAVVLQAARAFEQSRDWALPAQPRNCSMAETAIVSEPKETDNRETTL